MANKDTNLIKQVKSDADKYGSATSINIVRNAQGKMVGWTKAGSDVDKALSQGRQVYDLGKGHLSLDAPESYIELDKKTGKITVRNAPMSLTGERWDEMVKQLRLDTLSANYKADPNYAYPVNDSTTETQTIEDIIASYNEKDPESGLNAVQSWGQRYQNVDNFKYDFADTHKMIDTEGQVTPVWLTDEDVLNFFSNQEAFQTIKNTSVDNLTDSTRIILTEESAKKVGLDKADSWDGASIGAKDFMENYYNRQSKDWDKHQVTDMTDGSQNLDLFVWLENYISGQSAVTENGVTVYTHRDDRTAGLATAVSLYEILADIDPVCSFWQGAGDTVMSTFNAVETALEKTGEGAAMALMLIGDGVSWATQKVIAGSRKEEEFQLNKDYLPSFIVAQMAGYKKGTSFYDVSSSVIEQNVTAYQTQISRYNSAAAGTYAAVELISELAITIAIGNAFSKAALGGLEAASKTIASASEAATAFANAQATANGLSTAWRLTGNFVGAAGQTLNLIAQALQWGPTTAAVSILAESVGEALIQNPSAIGKILFSEETTPEAKQFMMQTVAGNAFGFGIGATAGKGLYKLGNTTIGRAVSTNFNRVVWTVSNWVGDSVDAIKVFFSNEDNIVDLINKGNPSKIDARMAKRLIRAAKQYVLDEGDSIKILTASTEEIAEQLSKYDDVMAHYYVVEGAMDHMASRGFYTAGSFLADPNSSLSDAYKSYMNVTNDLVDIAESAGLKASKVAGYAVLPEAVKDFITTKQHLAILEAYKSAILKGFDVGETIATIDKEITHFSGVLDNLAKELTPEIIAKSDEFIDANRTLWRSWTDFRIDKGLLDADQIEALRATGRWGLEGNLYVGQQRLADQPLRVMRRTDNLRDVRAIEEVGRYKFGSTEGFADPMLTFQNSLLSAAQKYDRQVVLAQFRGTGMVSTVVDADSLKLVNAVKAGKNSLKIGVSEAFEGAIESMSTGRIIDSAGELVAKGNKLTFVAKELAEGGLVNEADEIVDGFHDLLLTGNSKVTNMLENLAEEYAPKAKGVAKDYLIYSALQDDIEDFGKKVKATVFNELQQRTVDGKVLDVKEANKVADQITDSIKQNIKDRMDFNRVELSRHGKKAMTLVDTDAWHGEIRKLAEEIGDIKTANNVIAVQNELGQVELVKCSPLLSSFMTTSAATAQMSDGVLAKINYAWMQLFRFGTTGPNPVTWVNQFFRDFGNAWIMGGATKTIAQSVDIIEEAFGSNPAYYLKQFSDDFLKSAQEIAEQEGKSVVRVAAETEIAYGKEIVGKQTEQEALRAYRRMRDAQYIGGTADISLTSKALDTVGEVADKANWVNNTREEWLRARVYANNYAKAIQQGKTVSQARHFAEFYASNATTNFTRATTFLTDWQNTIPYLRSAINGTKSFWRLWQVDPVGVTGRIVGGMVIPLFGLTAISLSDEENRKVYKNIKEYQKADSFAFVIEGQAYFIPLPQEIAAVLNAPRQMIEAMYDVDSNSFYELAFSDILALSPLDLSGFANLDRYKIFEEGFWDRMQAGVTKLAAQILPKYANTLVALATNRDLYTGNKIDNSYTTVDPDTGEARVIDYNSGEFAKWLHQMFPNISAAMAENILKNTLGSAGVGELNWLTNLVQSISGEMSWADFGTSMVEGASGAFVAPLTGYVQDEANKAWKSMISQLYDEKEALMASDEYQAYLKAARTADSEEKLNAVATQRTNIVESFYERVKNAVQSYQTNYGQNITQAQFASVISLMVMFQNTGAGNVVLEQAQSDAYNAARAQAISTMNRLGFPNTGVQDTIFGRIRYSETTGETYIEYNNPLAVLNVQKSISLAADTHQVNIQNILDKAGLTRSKMFEGYYAATTRAEKKKAKADWNKQVVKALAPYIQQYGADAIVSNTNTVDFLDNYIFVNNPYNAKNYIKSIFKEAK